MVYRRRLSDRRFNDTNAVSQAARAGGGAERLSEILWVLGHLIENAQHVVWREDTSELYRIAEDAEDLARRALQLLDRKYGKSAEVIAMAKAAFAQARATDARATLSEDVVTIVPGA